VALGLLNRYDLGLDDSTSIRMCCQTQDAIAAGKIFLDTCACRGVAFGSLEYDIVTIKVKPSSLPSEGPLRRSRKKEKPNHDA